MECQNWNIIEIYIQMKTSGSVSLTFIYKKGYSKEKLQKILFCIHFLWYWRVDKSLFYKYTAIIWTDILIGKCIKI